MVSDDSEDLELSAFGESRRHFINQLLLFGGAIATASLVPGCSSIMSTKRITVRDQGGSHMSGKGQNFSTAIEVVNSTLDDKLRSPFNEIERVSPVVIGDVALVLAGDTQTAYLGRKESGVYVIQEEYSVSTGKRGFGNIYGSGKTPIGVHKINFKRARGAPVGAIFRNGHQTTDVARIRYSPNTCAGHAYMTTRILRISGLQSYNSNTLERNIYLHGTNFEGLIGQPASGGCVRFKNVDIIDLYSKVPAGAPVNIVRTLS